MIKAILIDDEKDAIESLTWEINQFCDNIEIIDSFTNPEEAISAINYLKPECVFLDIEMPEMDGFQLLSQLKFRDFDLVITTAYDNYAIQAFKESAIDYLLKPIDSDDLQKVTKKILKNKNKNSLGVELKSALDSILKTQNKTVNKIALPLNGKTVFIKLDDVYYCKSDGNYTTIFLKNDEKYLLSKKIKDIDALFNSKQIIRVHQSYLVNINYIKEYVKNDGYYLVLENRVTIPVSKANRTYLQKMIQNL
jgi:two-component system LytT family response regulator